VSAPARRGCSLQEYGVHLGEVGCGEGRAGRAPSPYRCMLRCHQVALDASRGERSFCFRGASCCYCPSSEAMRMAQLCAHTLLPFLGGDAEPAASPVCKPDLLADRSTLPDKQKAEEWQEDVGTAEAPGGGAAALQLQVLCCILAAFFPACLTQLADSGRESAATSLTSLTRCISTTSAVGGPTHSDKCIAAAADSMAAPGPALRPLLDKLAGASKNHRNRAPPPNALVDSPSLRLRLWSPMNSSSFSTC